MACSSLAGFACVYFSVVSFVVCFSRHSVSRHHLVLTLHFATLSVQCSASLQFSCRVSVFVFPPPPGLRTLLLHPGRRAQRQGVKNENEKNETNECHKTEHEGQKDDDSQGEHAQEHEHEEAACFQRRGRNANGAGQRERRWGTSRRSEKERSHALSGRPFP